MKKVIIAIICVLCLSGCTSSDKSDTKVLDLASIKSELSELKIDSEYPFKNNEYINNKETIEYYELDLSLIDDYLIYLPSEVVNASMYMIIKPKKEEVSVVKYQVEELFDGLYNAYEGYYPKQAKLIKDRMSKELNGYLIYVVSTDNDKVYDTIKKNKKD